MRVTSGLLTNHSTKYVAMLIQNKVSYAHSVAREGLCHSKKSTYKHFYTLMVET